MIFPRDTSLPFFAYGIFKKSEISFFQIKDFVKTTTESTIKGKLLVRDGLPIFDEIGYESVHGSVISFIETKQADAYKRISSMEPDKHYHWSENFVNLEKVNILHGNSPTKGSEFLDCQKWDSWSDPLFTNALDAIEDTFESYSTPNIKAYFNHNLKQMFHLQMAYLLLWSSIERYLSLRYNLGDSVYEKIKKLSQEDSFKNALIKHVEREAKIFRADNPRKNYQLNKHKCEESLNYYYQIRSNIAHRGKGSSNDFTKIKNSLKELLYIFKDVLESAKNEAL